MWGYPAWRDHKLIATLAGPDDTTRNAAAGELIALVRQQAEQGTAWRLGPTTLQRMETALDETDSDRQFLALYHILKRLGEFDVPRRSDVARDRLRLLNFLDSQPPKTTDTQPAEDNTALLRVQMIYDAIITGRDDKPNRRLLAAAVADPNPEVRIAAAMLAGALRSLHATDIKRGAEAADAFATLIKDDDLRVAAWAALCGVMAGSNADLDVADLLARFDDELRTFRQDATPEPPRLAALREAQMTVAYALATIQRRTGGKRPMTEIEVLTRKAWSPLQWEELRVVWGLFDSVPQGVSEQVVLGRETADSFAPAMGLETARRWFAGGSMLAEASTPKAPGIRGGGGTRGAPDASRASQPTSGEDRLARFSEHAALRKACDDAALKILRAAPSAPKGLLESQVIAAIDYASAMKLPCRKELYGIVEKLWYPGRPVLLTRAARALGEQVALDEGQSADAPSREKCMDLLRQAAQYSLATEGDGTTSQPAAQYTPMGSAAAAVALWLLEPSVDEFAVAESQPGEGYAELTMRRNSAFFVREAVGVDIFAAGDYVSWSLARTGLPAARQLGQRFLPARGSKRPEHSPEVRSTGAMLLALMATTPAERSDVISRIEYRLARESFFAKGSMRCALLAAGQRDVLPDVDMLLEISDFPRRRVLTALWADGRKRSLDLMLLNVGQPLDDVATVLLAEGLDDVLACYAPALPLPSAAADDATRAWQMRILRTAWAVRRSQIDLGRGQ